VHIELLVPALLLGRAMPRRLPALEMLVARARKRSDAQMSLEERLLDAFGAGRETMPAGALTVKAGGGEPGDALWLRADPVHLAQKREVLVVVPPPAIDLSQAEAEALAAALNDHFGAALEIDPVQPWRWSAKVTAPAALEALSPMQAAGRNVDSILPGGDAKRWHALLNEAQMLLHAHPVNAAREARGERVVNSLWLWGLGAMPQKVRSVWQTVSAEDPFARGLALAGGARCAPLPDGAAALLARLPGEGRHLVVLDEMRSADALGDAAGWNALLDALEARWIAPLLDALRAEHIGMITLHVPDAEESLSFELVRGDLRRFWRRPKPL